VVTISLTSARPHLVSLGQSFYASEIMFASSFF